jgi:hypothetical protein
MMGGDGWFSPTPTQRAFAADSGSRYQGTGAPHRHPDDMGKTAADMAKSRIAAAAWRETGKVSTRESGARSRQAD